MAVYFGISLVALVASLALAIDIGRLYNAQRSLQRAANVAALDAARVANGCLGYVADASAQSVAQTEVAASLVRNNVPAGYLPSNGVQLGRLSRTNNVRYFEPLGSSDASSRTAVQVRLQRPPPGRLIPLTAGPIMTATAAADSRPVASFGVASGLVSLNNGLVNDLLGGLVGGKLTLTAVQYQGLANTTVRLGDLAVAAGVATVDDYLTAQTSLPAAFNNILNGLGNGSNGSVRTALTQIAAASNASRRVTAGNVLTAPLGLDGASENALINVGQLVMALAQSANGTNAINIPNLHVNVPGVANVSARIAVIEPQQIAVARAGDRTTYASTSQAQIELTLNLLSVNLGLVTTNISLPISIRLAQAFANLDEVQCARRGQSEHRVSLETQTRIAAVGIGTFGSSINSPTPTISKANIANVTLRVLLVNVPIGVQASALTTVGQNQGDSLEFEGPFPAPVQAVGTNVGPALDSALSSLTSSLSLTTTLPLGLGGLVNAALTPLLNTLKSAITTVLTPVLDVVSGLVLEPVLSALGLSVGNADVQVISLQPVNDPDGNDPTATDDQLSLQAFLFTH